MAKNAKSAKRSNLSDEELTALLRQFLALNQKLSKSPAKAEQVREWYQMKQKLETGLFANPPVAKDPRQSVRIGGLKQPVMFEGDFDGLEGMIKEVSEKGLFVAVAEPLPVGSEVGMSVSIDDAKSGVTEIHLRARVVYSNMGYSLVDRAFTGMGMALLDDVLPEERQKWFRWIDVLMQEVSGMYVK